jgi:phenylalanyl-tRNA synthetase alpha subunit
LANVREEVQMLVQQLERQRDELQVKMSLAKLEARQEWEQLEKQYQHLKANSSQIQEEVGSTLRKTAEEIRDDYARLRKLL